MRTDPIRWAAVALVLLLTSAAATEAQDVPAWTVSLSYSALKDTQIKYVFKTGWAASIAYRISNSYDIIGEVGGQYSTFEATRSGPEIGFDIHTFMGGVRYGGRLNRRLTLFAQGLAGAARYSTSVDTCGSLSPADCSVVMASDYASSYFSIQPGAGMDVGIGRRIGIRVQGDYRAVYSPDAEDLVHEFRFTAGLAVGFGKR